MKMKRPIELAEAQGFAGLRPSTNARIRRAIRQFYADRGIVDIDGERHEVVDVRIVGTLGKWGRA